MHRVGRSGRGLARGRCGGGGVGRAVRGWGGVAVGVVSAGVAVVFLLRGEGDDDRPAAIQAIVAPGQGGLVVAVQGPLP